MTEPGFDEECSITPEWLGLLCLTISLCTDASDGDSLTDGFSMGMFR